MQKQHPFRFIFHFLQAHRGKMWLAIVSSILHKICDIMPEILISVSIDVIVRQEESFLAGVSGIDEPLIQLYLIIFLTSAIWVAKAITEYSFLTLWRSLAQDVTHDIRIKTFNHIQTLDFQTLEHKENEMLMAGIHDDIIAITNFIIECPNIVIQLVINVLFIGSIFFVISPMLAMLSLTPFPILIFIFYVFQSRLQKMYKRLRHSAASLNNYIADYLNNIFTIKGYATSKIEVAGLSKVSRTYKALANTANNIGAFYVPFVRVGILFHFIVIMFMGGKLVLTESLPISLYSVLIFLSQRFLWPFTNLTLIIDMYEEAMSSVKRIRKVWSFMPTIKTGSLVLDKDTMSDEICFNNISFGYISNNLLFQDFNLTIPAHTITAFVGPTGSGKSTLAKLIMRFYDVDKGSITIDNVDIRDLHFTSLYRTVGLVGQTIPFTDKTIAETICYGNHDITESDMIKAARMAAAHNFITELPYGYETILNTGSHNFSDGEIQCLALAQAFARDPSILILDESLSGLDSETEEIIQKSIRSFAKDHTVILISNRLATITNADAIFVIDEGTIIEAGTHAELIKNNGYYAMLWDIQAGKPVKKSRRKTIFKNYRNNDDTQ